VDQLFPSACLYSQLFSACRRQPIVPGFAIVLGCTPEGSNPFAVFKAMQCRVKRPMLYLKDIVRSVLDGIRDGVAVRRPQHQGLQDEQIKSSLKNFTLQRLCSAFGHLTGIVLH
jgi:hypothetical protein